MSKQYSDGVINPFSDCFLSTWQLWKDFRWEEHKFKYKGVISEQMALKKLVEVSDGDEQKAIRIVEQSISRTWMDFYALKQPSNKDNGKSKQQPVNNNKESKSGNVASRDSVQAAINKRYGGGGQTESEPYLKAV